MAQRLDQQALLLGDLLPDMGYVNEVAQIPIAGITQNSAEVDAGHLFIALAGQHNHGMQYAGEVIQKGAAAIVVEPGGEWSASRLQSLAQQAAIPLIIVHGLRQKAALMAARFFGHPAQLLRLIGITGTNGKTSVSHFLAQALAQHSITGVMGTLGNGLLDDLQATTHTTPDAVQVQAELARQLILGVKAVAMEVSSHALDQGRVAGVPFHTAVFTNLSHDHQDYHANMQAYADAKASLLRRRGLLLAVINSDDLMGRELLNEMHQRVVTVACGGHNNTATLGDRFIQMQQVEVDPSGLHIQFDSSWGSGAIHSPLWGRFNVENLLLTLGVLLAWQVPLNAAIKALQDLQPIVGRMSLRGGAGQPLVLIDYAHTPDALEKVLSSVREHVQGQLFCVFGCGGGRDQDKRPIMGELAQRLADRVWITDDNPRKEDGDAIVQQIYQGVSTGGDKVQIERDRAQAITQAVTQAAANDVVVVAGKGHETYQLLGDLTVPFSDFLQVEQALQRYAA